MASSTSKETIGDLRNNLMKLVREIKRMKLTVDFNLQGLSLGCPSSFLPILHASLMHYSLPLANWLTRQGYELYAKSDLRFIEGLYKVLRDVFHYRPRLSKEQFLSVGFAEHKVIFATQILLLCQAKHQQLAGKNEANKAPRKRRSDLSKTSSVDSTIITIVKSEGTNSRATQSFTSEVLSDNSHRFSVSGESSTFKPTALYDMYSPLLSPHQATPSSDLELTPRPSPPTTPQVHTSVGMETNAHTSDDSTLVTNTTSVQATNLIDMATPKYLDDASLTTESSPNKSIRVDQETVVENKEISNGSVALLVNISSRINDLLKMVESVSARVDLVETQMKTLHDVTSAQDRIANTDTTHVQKSVTNSSNVDTPHILQCKQSAHSQQLIMDHTHAHTQLTYTPHRAYISSSPVSTYDVTASPSVSHTKQTTHSQPLSVHSTTPSTPEEAHRLIASLRSRAKKTRDFLHHANSAYYRTT